MLNKNEQYLCTSKHNVIVLPIKMLENYVQGNVYVLYFDIHNNQSSFSGFCW